VADGGRTPIPARSRFLIDAVERRVLAGQLCLYGPAPLATAMVPGGDRCGAKPCWTATSTGFRYSDPSRTMRAIRRVRVSANPAASLLSIDGHGDALPLPAALPVGGPVTAQLILFERGIARCWEAVYAAPAMSTPTDLRASH
jgi:hypothetical protein